MENNNYKKKYKIFIMTKDSYYIIIEKRKLYKSLFFYKLFKSDKTAGNIKNPIFLPNIESKYLKILIEYLEYYHDKNDYIKNNKNIKYYDIEKYINNEFDKKFFKKYKKIDYDNLKYFGVKSLNIKIDLVELFENKINKNINKK